MLLKLGYYLRNKYFYIALFFLSNDDRESEI